MCRDLKVNFHYGNEDFKKLMEKVILSSVNCDFYMEPDRNRQYDHKFAESIESISDKKR